MVKSIFECLNRFLGIYIRIDSASVFQFCQHSSASRWECDS